jgi:hypothetical protein
MLGLSNGRFTHQGWTPKDGCKHPSNALFSDKCMPTTVQHDHELQPGDYYEDCAYHPCLCVASGNGLVDGISLVDGSFPRNCGIPQCDVRKLTAEEAITWRLYGPQDVPDEFETTFDRERWWLKDASQATIVWPAPRGASGTA